VHPKDVEKKLETFVKCTFSRDGTHTHTEREKYTGSNIAFDGEPVPVPGIHYVLDGEARYNFEEFPGSIVRV
jgi:hypothetical protein